MTEREWSKLCRNIYEKKCILMIGSEFPIELEAGGVETNTTFSELLFNLIAKDVAEYEGLPPFYDTAFVQKDLCQLVRDFIYYSGNNQIQSRGDLETMISDYLLDISPHISSKSFDKIAGLPFYFIVDTNYGNLFFNILQNKGKQPQQDYYNFKGQQVSLSNALATYNNIGTPQKPLVYHLYGSIKETKSMAISDYDLIQLLNNIISKTPSLPADVRSELANEETSILFIGFGILVKNWYFRILLHALTSGNKKTMSYALDYLNTVNYAQDSTVLFFKDELKVCLYNYDQTTFIDTLCNKYNAFAQRQQSMAVVSNENNRVESKEMIKVFLSYKREDIERTKAIAERIKSDYITVLWDQSDEFNGDWEKRIQEMINSSDAFVLLQSMNLKNERATYVFNEARLAKKKAEGYPRLDSYLYPAFIDSKDARLLDTDFNFIDSINNWDLTTVENIDKMVKEIIRNQERNKKSNVA